MILMIGRDIHDQSGRLLLAKGYQCEISQENYDRLKRLGILDKLSSEEIPTEWENKASAPQAMQTLGSSNVLVNSLLASLMRGDSSPISASLQNAHQTVEGVLFGSEQEKWHPLLAMLTNHVGWLYSHSINVALVSCLMGAELRYVPRRLELLALGAMMHDIGQTLLPRAVLEKPGKLTAAEMIIVRNHCEMGQAMLRGYEFPELANRIVLQHHERLNGTGYPRGLSKQNIPEDSRIVAIAEIFDTATTARPYKAAKSVNQVLLELESMPELYDERLVKVLAKSVQN